VKRGRMSGNKFVLARGESFHMCPYEPSHVLTNVRISGHVQKCRSKFFRDMEMKGVAVEYAVCRYSQMHKVPKIELEYHEEWCPNKDRLGVEVLIKEIQKMNQAQARAQAAKGVEDKAIVEPEPKHTEKPYKVSCPAALISGILPPQDRMLPRHVLWDKLNRAWAEKSEKLIKEKHEAIKNAYFEPIRRSPVPAVPSTAAAIAQFDEKKKEEERKKQDADERKKKMDENCKEFWQAFEKRKQEAALAAQKKKDIEECKRDRDLTDLN